MRLGELDAALAQLDRAPCPAHMPRCRVWEAGTRARIYTRQQQFIRAQEALTGLPPLPPNDWIAALPPVAQAELLLEQNQIKAAETAFRRVLDGLPTELVEERVQAPQSLGFISITFADITKALPYLDQARQILRGAGAWLEVIQRNVVVGNFHISLSQPAAAQALFDEALALCQEDTQPQFERLLQLSTARLQVAKGQYDDAIAASLQTANLFARQGNVLGYVSMIVHITRIFIHAKKFTEAYRTLVTGISIARHLHLPLVEKVFRTQIDTLRNEIMGPKRFDAMVQDLLHQATDRK